MKKLLLDGTISDWLVMIGFGLLVLLVVTLYFYFFSLKPYRRALKQVLFSQGLGKKRSFLVIWRLRKDLKKYIRLFLEFSIIQSAGKRQEDKWWKEMTDDFEAWLKRGDEVIHVPFLSQITSTEIDHLIQRYFLFLKEQKSFFELKELSFLSSIQIKEGYLMPAILIQGLEDQFQEDWIKIVGKYLTVLAEDKDQELIPHELFMCYCWLMWGPSYQMNYGDKGYRLVQYGLADEANSIDAVIPDDEQGQQIWNLLNPHNQEQFGLFCTITGKIKESKTYFRKKRERFTYEAHAFMNRLENTDLGFSFLVEIQSCSLNNTYKARNYFFDAFLWIMFQVETDTHSHFDPKRVVTFFKPANLADVTNYRFFTDQLIQMCQQYFDKVFQDERFSGRSYRLCLAMNEEIKRKFLDSLDEWRNQESNSQLAEAYRTRIKEEMIFQPIEIFDSFDHFFYQMEEGMEFVLIDTDKEEHHPLFCDFYTDIYLNEWGNNSKRKKIDDIFSLISNGNLEQIDDHSNYIVLLVNRHKQNQIIGGVVFRYIRSANAGCVQLLSINSAYRDKGYGSLLYKEALYRLRKDAMIKEKKSLDWVFAFVDREHQQQISFWDKLHFREVQLEQDEISLEWQSLLPSDELLVCAIFNPEWKDQLPTEILSEALYRYISFTYDVFPQQEIKKKRVKEKRDFVETHALGRSFVGELEEKTRSLRW